MENTTEQKPVYEVGYFAHLNKNDTIEQYENEVLKGDYYKAMVKVEKVLNVDLVTFRGLQNSFLDNYLHLSFTSGI